MLLSRLRPSRMAQSEQPAPRCATTSRPAARDRILGGDLRQDRFVGQAVKAVAAQPFGMESAAAGRRHPPPRVAAVEGGVEAGDLRHPGEGGGSGVQPGEVVRLVQRRKRHQRRQPCAQGGVHHRRGSEIRATVYDAVPDRDRPPAAQGLPQPGRQWRPAPGRGWRRRAGADGFRRLSRPAAQPRRAADSLHLAAQQPPRRIGRGVEHRKLHRGGTGIHHEDRRNVRHAVPCPSVGGNHGRAAEVAPSPSGVVRGGPAG